MPWSKELKLLCVTTIIMLEADFLETGAMESKRASILTASDDDMRALELCTTRNQQRLGSVFGNYTRHSKKGHRRRTTTASPTTALTTDVDFTTDTATETTTNKNIPKPLALTALDITKEYAEHVNIDNILNEDEIREFIERERHKAKHRGDREREIHHELSTVSRNRVKKMYRDSSGAVVNKLNSKEKGGIFLTENCTTVIAQIGTTAVLHCEVSDITENTVTWIRRKDYSLLSVGLVTYSADSRFFSAHGRHVKDWALHIRFGTSADAGFYECQVPTHPPTSIFFKLVLVAAYAEINGESEKIIHEGSMLRLVCVVRRSTEPPSYVFWYFENRMINYDLNGVNVHNGRQTSELVIGRAEPRHAGNYTCVPANAKAASVTVHVIQSETPAAMQHGNNSSSSRTQLHITVLLLVALECCRCLYTIFQK